MTNFYGITTPPLRVISIELTIGRRMTKTIFFVIDVATTYNVLLRQDWIHASRSIPSSLHQYLIIWHDDRSTKVVKAITNSFMVTSNMANALLYVDEIGPMTFYDRDDEGRYTSYAVTQGPLM